MKFQTKKSPKDKPKLTNQETDSSQMQNRLVKSNTSEFPMKRFKGTKSHLDKSEDKDNKLNTGKKRKADSDFSDDIHLKKGKNMTYDPLKLMSKLEQFSDIWNDCPDVENPKTDFEVVKNNNNEKDLYNKQNNFENKIKRTREHKTSNRSIPNESRKAQHFKEESIQEINGHQNSCEIKGEIELKGNKMNKLKEKIVEIPGKYDSKVAEMKRKKAVQEQSQLHADQKNIIKKALSSMDVKQQVNKKIVFSDAEENEETQTEVILDCAKAKTQQLFEDGDSSEADFELKINRQFEGRKGQKLLELQSKFASDSRFTLDSRFHDSESENEKDTAPSENLDTNEEKKRQLEILESIVKQRIRPLSETRKASSKKYDDPIMVRFDPSREDHKKYLLIPKKPLQENEVKETNKKRSKKDSRSLENIEESNPQVSSEKVYAVKEDLKQVLKKENKTEFSLLKLFGSKDEDSNTQQHSTESVKKLKYATKNPFRYDSSESETEEEESKVEEKEKDRCVVKPSLPSWRTTFFFTDTDSRLKEAEEFLRGPVEPESDQAFTEKRKMLKDFIRHKFKNNNRKKDPFKKKLGGVKKKAFHKKKGK